MNIEVEMYKHKLEDECLRNMKKAIFCEETFASYHENFIEEAMKPDLVGKNVKVTEKQLRSEEHTSELQSRQYLVCRLLLEKKKEHIYPQLTPITHLNYSNTKI